MLGCLTACTSLPSLRQGIQADAVALNPARIAALPTLVIPHPVEQASIDPASLMSGELTATLETRILAAFKNQPGVNGIAFQTVRTALKTNPKIYKDLDNEMRTMGELANSGTARETLLLTSECRARKNFLDFYQHCLLKSQRWIGALNQLSMAVQNADSTMIPIITAIEKNTEKDVYALKFGLALLLVDTNNGRLIWGRDVTVKLSSTSGSKQFPEVAAAYDKLFTESFWAEFPGRRSRTENSK